MTHELKEFIAGSEAAAVALAELHYGVSAGELETCLVPEDLDVAGLVGRTLLLAGVKGAAAQPDRRPRERSDSRGRSDSRDRQGSRGRGDRERAPRQERPDVSASPPGPLGEYVGALVEKMGAGDDLKVEERRSDGENHITIAGEAIGSLASANAGLAAAIAHLAERKAERLEAAESVVHVELPGQSSLDRDRPRRGDARESNGRGRRDRGRPERGGARDRDRGRDAPRGDDDAGPQNPELERLARESAERVRETGEPATLDEMSSRDRWVVHNALKDVNGVRSESVGDGRLKRVKILPA